MINHKFFTLTQLNKIKLFYFFNSFNKFLSLVIILQFSFISSNIKIILFTLLVLKLDKFNEVKEDNF